MMYLIDLGLDEEKVKLMNKNIPEEAISKIDDYKQNVIANINYLKNLGVSNYSDAFIKFYDIFLLNPDKFEEIFSKYDMEDLVIKLEKNIAILEYL